MRARTLMMLVPLGLGLATGCVNAPSHAGIIVFDGEALLVSETGAIVISPPDGASLAKSGLKSPTTIITAPLRDVTLTCEVGCTAEAGRDYVSLDVADDRREVVIVVSKPGYEPARLRFDAADDGRQFENKVAVLFRLDEGRETEGAQ